MKEFTSLRNNIYSKWPFVITLSSRLTDMVAAKVFVVNSIL